MTRVATAVLLATARTDGGGPAADLPFEGVPLAERLAGQLHGLGVDDVQVLRRPGSPDPAADLREIARIARGAAAGVVVAPADVVTQHEALAGLLADPRIGTGVLSSVRGVGAPFTFGQRSERGGVVAAESAYHALAPAGERFLGVLKVAAGDVAELVAVADRLADILERGLPSAWEAEFARKQEAWAGQPGAAARAAAAREDVVALLVVALARAGVTVGASDVRELFWARPLSAAEASAAEREIAAHDEEQVKLDSAVKATDGFFTTFFVSPYSKYLARWAARRRLTPNQVTVASLVLGVLAATAFAFGTRWGLIAGAVLLQVAFTTDCVDGQLARFTRTFSPLGAWLDSTFDRLKEWLVYGGLALGASHMGRPVWALAGAALTLQLVRHALGFADEARERGPQARPAGPPLEEPGDGWGGAGDGATAARGQDVLRRWKGLDRVPGLVWLKRMAVFPIGERFAAISLTAALFVPHTTFVVLLVWGGLAGIYGLAGRVLRAAR